ncbi:hypothetical protein FDB14_15265 [Clostridium botulinum]|nr:hypothetical protein [Clostridium botulinum]NFK66127.1 hypothetical protein [Clostridium botulinum]NFK69187.1 hypothetical protein [Clostridium botulinum]NFK97536.1 hypothetical protein [Clostridium botulinum]
MENNTINIFSSISSISSIITAITPLIIAVIGIIAPIFVAKSNNQTQLKIKNFDMCYREKSDVYQRYINSLKLLDEWESIDNMDDYPCKEYQEIHNLAYLIGNDEIRLLLDKVSFNFGNACMNINEYQNFKKQIIKSMSNDLQQYRK